MSDTEAETKVQPNNDLDEGFKNVEGEKNLDEVEKEDRANKEEEEAETKELQRELPDGAVAYSGNVQQLLDRKYTDPQIVVPTDCWEFQPINPGIIIPPFLGDPVEYEKIKPPAVVKTLEERLSELTDDERTALEQLRQHCKDKGYSGDNTTDWSLIRYGIARQWKVKKSIEMIDATFKWRDGLTPEQQQCIRCRTKPQGHCMTFVGWDLQHRPVMYMSHRWALERGNVKDDMAHVVDSYDHILGKMPEGVTQWVSMVDFVTYSHWRDGSPSTGKQVGGLLQNHYPERLALQVLIDPPTSFWLLWKVIGPFMDPKTKSKVCFWYTKEKEEPNIVTEFPKILPPHLCEWMINTFMKNKEKEPKKK